MKQKTTELLAKLEARKQAKKEKKLALVTTKEVTENIDKKADLSLEIKPEKTINELKKLTQSEIDNILKTIKLDPYIYLDNWFTEECINDAANDFALALEGDDEEIIVDTVTELRKMYPAPVMAIAFRALPENLQAKKPLIAKSAQLYNPDPRFTIDQKVRFFPENKNHFCYGEYAYIYSIKGDQADIYFETTPFITEQLSYEGKLTCLNTRPDPLIRVALSDLKPGKYTEPLPEKPTKTKKEPLVKKLKRVLPKLKLPIRNNSDLLAGTTIKPKAGTRQDFIAKMTQAYENSHDILLVIGKLDLAICTLSGKPTETKEGWVFSFTVKEKLQDYDFKPDTQITSKPDNVPRELSGKYELITDNETLQEAISLREKAEVMAIDTETTGLDPHTSKIRLVQIATNLPNLATLVIDCFKCDLKLVQPLLNSDTIKVFHNAKFDLKFLRKAGLEINQRIFDTMLADYLINVGKNLKSNLKEVAQRYLFLELNKDEQKSDFSQELSEDQLIYAAKDAEVLLPLREKLKDLLIENNLSEAAKIEFRCAYTTAEMELSGISIDRLKWDQVTKETKTKKATLEAELKSELKYGNNQLTLIDSVNEINLDSPAQVKSALNTLGFNITSTSVSALGKLAQTSPVIAKLLNYRKLQKMLTSFSAPLLDKINPVTGKLHCDFIQTGSRAGRYSCGNPNLQQIPRGKEVRACFIPSSGNKLVIADYSQIELRIAAEIAGDQTMIQAYKNNEDLHKLTASIILNKPLDEVTKADRQIAKSANFGLLYGSGVNGFRGYAETNYGIELSENEAAKIRENFFKKYDGLAKWHKSTSYKLKSAHETRTLANRRRLFPQGEGENKLTEFLNTPVQGTGADILKKALGDLPEALKGTGAKVLATVHDEIILEAPENEAEKVAKILSEVMINAGKAYLRKLPVEAEASIGNSWADKA